MHTAKRITYKESYLFNIYLGYKFKYGTTHFSLTTIGWFPYAIIVPLKKENPHLEFKMGIYNNKG